MNSVVLVVFRISVVQMEHDVWVPSALETFRLFFEFTDSVFKVLIALTARRLIILVLALLTNSLVVTL